MHVAMSKTDKKIPATAFFERFNGISILGSFINCSYWISEFTDRLKTVSVFPFSPADIIVQAAGWR
jgi:hypothetical protein